MERFASVTGTSFPKLSEAGLGATTISRGIAMWWPCNCPVSIRMASPGGDNSYLLLWRARLSSFGAIDYLCNASFFCSVLGAVCDAVCECGCGVVAGWGREGRKLLQAY